MFVFKSCAWLFVLLCSSVVFGRSSTTYRQLCFGCLLIHDDDTRMALDSAIAYLVGHVVVVFGAEFDTIVLHSRSQISLGGLWRESRFMVSHVTLTY